MRRPILSLGAGTGLLIASIALAQNAGETGGSAPTLPVGQTFKQFEFPVYQDGQLKYTLYATEAKGVTLNRAETSNLKIDVYDNPSKDGKPTTTITSPKADLYAAEQKMRTKYTVHIERADMDATSQDCDFDVKAKKFLLRTRVKVLLKHFDVGGGAPGSPKAATTTTPGPVPPPSSTPAPVPESAPAPTAATPDNAVPAPASAEGRPSMLSSPGAISDTNSAPLPPSSSTTK